ncbi:MAG: hypothetical protein AB1609_03540 [Bacillota bacterium]
MPQARGVDLSDKVWLPWVQEGPYLARRQHLVAKDEDQVSLSPVPVGQQLRGLAKLTLDELRRLLPPAAHAAAQRLARQLVEGRPLRLILRDERRAGRREQDVLDALMALCRAGLVQVYCRNRRRAAPEWEVRHAELSNWGKAALISVEAVTLPGTPRPVPPGHHAQPPGRNGRPRPRAVAPASANDAHPS